MTVMKYNKERANQGTEELSFPKDLAAHPRAKCWTQIYIDEEFDQDQRPDDITSAFDGEKELEVNWDIDTAVPVPMDLDHEETFVIASSELFDVIPSLQRPYPFLESTKRPRASTASELELRQKNSPQSPSSKRPAPKRPRVVEEDSGDEDGHNQVKEDASKAKGKKQSSSIKDTEMADAEDDIDMPAGEALPSGDASEAGEGSSGGDGSSGDGSSSDDESDAYEEAGSSSSSDDDQSADESDEASQKTKKSTKQSSKKSSPKQSRSARKSKWFVWSKILEIPLPDNMH